MPKKLFDGLFIKFRYKRNMKENESFNANSDFSCETSVNSNKSIFSKKLGLKCDVPAVVVFVVGDGMDGIVEMPNVLG